MPETIEQPWKVVFTATDRSFNIIECPNVITSAFAARLLIIGFVLIAVD